MAKRKAVKAKKPTTKKAKPRVSKLEEDMAAQLKEAGIGFTREFKFHATRKWRFDFAWPKSKVALEVEGAIFTGGRHSRGAGMMKDMEKYNTAACLGWRVLRVGAPHLKSGEALEWVNDILGGE